MSLRGAPDLLILAATLLLVAFGLTMMLCASADCWQGSGSQTDAQSRQFQRALIGLIALGLAYSIRPEWMFKLATAGAIAAAVLVGLTLTPLGRGPEGQEAERWLSLHFLKVTLQPSELLKLAMVLYLARMLARKGERVASFKGMLPPVIMVLVLAGLVAAEPSVGMAVSIALVGLGLIFVAGAKPWHMTTVCVLTGAAAAQIIWLIPYAQKRALLYLNGGGDDPLGQGYQLKQSLIALGSGGLLGRGFGESLQKFQFLPASHTDFVYSIVGEEGGFVVALLVLGFYALIVTRALQLSVTLADPFKSLVAAGIALMISVQVILNIAVVTGLVPTTGLPLPFMSYGGSSLVVHLAAIGVLLRMSTGAPRERTA